MAILDRVVPKLRDGYCVPAAAAALAMHLLAALSVCTRDGHMTREQARELISRIGELEFKVEEFRARSSPAKGDE